MFAARSGTRWATLTSSTPVLCFQPSRKQTHSKSSSSSPLGASTADTSNRIWKHSKAQMKSVRTWNFLISIAKVMGQCFAGNISKSGHTPQLSYLTRMEIKPLALRVSILNKRSTTFFVNSITKQKQLLLLKLNKRKQRNLRNLGER